MYYMTDKELSKIEVRINVGVLWLIVAAIASGSFIIATTYADIRAELKLIKFQMEQLEKKVK